MLTGLQPQPPDSVPPQEVSHAVLAGGEQQLSGGGAAGVAVEDGGLISASGSRC